MFSSGPQFGPFVPDSLSYLLRASSGSVGYQISGWPSWLTPLATRGTVTTSPTWVTFLVNSNAQTMVPGTYGPSTVTFANTTNGQGNTTRNATLRVTPVPTLQVSPASDLAVSGNQGGPFSPQSFTYTLSSTAGDVRYEIDYTPSWLTASSTTGIAAAAGTNVTFTVNASASTLPPGGYSSTIVFLNRTNGRGNQTRFASLLVRAPPARASLQGLGSLPGDHYSLAYGVSADGNVPVGVASQRVPGDEGFRAYRWSAANGMVSLGVLTGAINSEARATNADGSVVVGNNSGASPTQAFRWVNGTMSGLGFVPGYTSYSAAYGVNSDGTVVVGTSGGQAFRWVNGAIAGLGFLPGNDISVAYGTSADGSIVVGFSCSSNPGCHGVSSVSRGSQAFLWSNGMMTGLGALPGGGDSVATAMNANGTIAVGYSADSSNHTQAFRWVTGSGMTGLGFLPGGDNSGARAVSANGTVVVGQSNGTGGGTFRWTPAQGMKSIAELLSAAGVNLAGWSLQSAEGISADGTVIVGIGSGPDGSGSWIAHLPLP
jgi:probable HAF family extracellular repeat protein